jgi:SET domain-containing protein
VGELINMKEFYRREKAQEATGTMYCMDLHPQDDAQDKYCIDSGYRGNHARFINHSVCFEI